MQQPVETLTYRPLDLQNDLGALARLLREVAQADAAGEQVTEATLREQLTWSGQDPACNNWIVALPNNASLVGSGLIQKVSSDPNADLHLAIHPTWRRQSNGAVDRDLYLMSLHRHIQRQIHRFVDDSLIFSHFEMQTISRIDTDPPETPSYHWRTLPIAVSVTLEIRE